MKKMKRIKKDEEEKHMRKKWKRKGGGENEDRERENIFILCLFYTIFVRYITHNNQFIKIHNHIMKKMKK